MNDSWERCGAFGSLTAVVAPAGRASVIALVGFLSLAAPGLLAMTPAEYRAAWQPLINRNDFAQARTLCEGWLAQQERAALAEAHRCLANVELGESRVRKPEIEGKTDEIVVPRYEGPGVDRAFQHVNRALALDPSDIATHLGRMALLVRSNHIEELPRALERSLASYRGPDAYEHWLRVPTEMLVGEQYEVALDMYRVLEPRYRDSPAILGAIGRALRHLQRPDEALPYLFRALAFDPEDPLLHYEIAEAQDLVGSDDAAEVQLRKAIDLQPDETLRHEWLCRLGVFLETKRGDRDAACDLERIYCTSGVASACAPPEPPTGPSCVPPDVPP